MTRQDILNQFEVDANKVIRTLGKFEGEPIYVPYFWDFCLNGGSDADVNGVFFVVFDAESFAQFPELYLNTWDGVTDPTPMPAYGIALEESEQGFVYSKVYDTRAEYEAAIEEMERQESLNNEEDN